jgi:hypothetical protein
LGKGAVAEPHRASGDDVCLVAVAPSVMPRSVRRERAAPRAGEAEAEFAAVASLKDTEAVLRRYRVGGGQGIRFCYDSLEERFQRSPTMIDSEESPEALRAALTSTPKLQALVKKPGS